MLKLFPYVFKNVLRKRTRSLLTVVSIVLPLFVICLLATILYVFESDPSQGRAMFRVAVRHKVSLANDLPLAYGEKLRVLPGVLRMTTLNWFGGKYIDNSPRNFFARFMVDPETFLGVFDEVIIAQGSEKEWKAKRDGALVPEAFLEKYGWKMGDKITFMGDIYPVDVNLTIVATYHAPQEDGVYFHRKYVEEALPMQRGVGMFWLKTDSPQTVARLCRETDVLFENTPFPTRTESEKEFQNQWIAMLGNVKLLIRSMGSIMAVVILLIASNTMAMSARERVTEIATLRVLGFKARTILLLILMEASVLSLTGGLLGIVACLIGIPGLRAFMAASPGVLSGWAPIMKVFPEVLLLGFGITFGIGLLSGLVPAIRASQRPITEGLRYVG